MVEAFEHVKTQWLFTVHENALGGEYVGEISLKSENISRTIDIRLEVQGEEIHDEATIEVTSPTPVSHTPVNSN